MKKQNFHGSDIISVATHYNHSPEEVVNFAGNVNPLGTSKNALKTLSHHLNLASEYPDRYYTKLKKAISHYCHTASDKLLIGNGSTELISLGIKHINAKKALIIGPTYSEYQRELNLLGCSLDEFRLSHEDNFNLNTKDLLLQLGDNYDFLIICNPNNPTATSLNQDTLRYIVEECSNIGIFVMIDETYIEFANDMENTTAIPLCDTYKNLLVLRGFSKFYAAPGIRLGYGICGNQDLIDTINSHQNPWSVSSYAEFLSQLLLNDAEYISHTRELIKTEKMLIESTLRNNTNFKLYPSDSNFYLLEILNPDISTSQLFHLCMKEKLFIRDCNSFFGESGNFIRFCVMMPEDNKRLIELLNSI